MTYIHTMKNPGPTIAKLSLVFLVGLMVLHFSEGGTVIDAICLLLAIFIVGMIIWAFCITAQTVIETLNNEKNKKNHTDL